MDHTAGAGNGAFCKLGRTPLLEELNLPEQLAAPPSAWPLARALAWSRDGNPRYKPHTADCAGGPPYDPATRRRCSRGAAGARRRSHHEHELDRLVALLVATESPGTVVRLPNGQWVEPWALLHARLDGRAPAIVAIRAKILLVVEWCRANGPRHGWARRQSFHRTQRKEHATTYNLPARSRRAFYTYRRAVRAIVALLALLHVWWERLCPARRSASLRTESGETRSVDRQPRLDSERSAGHSGPRRLGDVLGQVMPDLAM